MKQHTYHCIVQTPAWSDRDVVTDCHSPVMAATQAVARATGSVFPPLACVVKVTRVSDGWTTLWKSNGHSLVREKGSAA